MEAKPRLEVAFPVGISVPPFIAGDLFQQHLKTAKVPQLRASLAGKMMLLPLIISMEPVGRQC
jgi:hypothetical protein